MSVAEKLVEIARDLPKVYDAGFAAGQNAGGGGSYDEGYAAGKQAEYDRFWDGAQNYGNRVSYTNGFSGASWNDETYNPKYPIVCQGLNAANNLFLYNGGITDIKVPVTLNGTITQSAFANASIQRIPHVKLIGTVNFTQTFNTASNLTYIRFEGEIQKSINFQWSKKLDRNSLDDIFDHLSKTVTGQTLTMSNTAVANAYTDEEWEARIAPYTNWTINRIED